jgi:hypothetical protein
MSAQSVNTAEYRGFTAATDPTGIRPRFPLRDASDYVRMKRERLVRVDAPVDQSNTQRLVYNMGRIRCGTCTAGPFLKTAIGQTP